MSETVIDQIRNIRNENDFEVNLKNTNRYCVIVKEEDGSNTAYCFGAPIYNIKTKKIVNRSFSSSENGPIFVGSNSNVYLGKGGISFKRNDGVELGIEIPCTSLYHQKEKVIADNIEITPTLNGVMVSFPIKNSPARFKVRTNKRNFKIRHNSKFFALMEEKFLPAALICATGETDECGNVCAPALISYLACDNGDYMINVSPGENKGSRLLIEIDMYDPKMYQDTTVESIRENENNSFGTVGFLGKGKVFGEQWLYTRPDISKISFLNNHHINKALWYVPVLGNSNGRLEMYKTIQRFCSFGSTWHNKIPLSNKVCVSKSHGKYDVFDITSVLSNNKTGTLARVDGLIIRTDNKDSDCVIISTGDSLYKPQILAINYS